MPTPKKKREPRLSPAATASAYRRGYLSGRTQAREKVALIVQKIVGDINLRSGLSPMLWNDKEQREKIVNRWIELGEEVLE